MRSENFRDGYGSMVSEENNWMDVNKWGMEGKKKKGMNEWREGRRKEGWMVGRMMGISEWEIWEVNLWKI